jgi:REP element-mobilizing transposase RayT
MNVLPTTTQCQATSADSVLQELKSLIQQSPVDIVPMPDEPKHVHSITHSKSNYSHVDSIGRETARTMNMYGSSHRPGTAVKSTVSAAGGATIRKGFSQQTTTDDRMFFGRPTSTIGQGQYHNRTGLMPNNRQQQPQQQQQSIALTPSMGQQRRVTTSTGMEYQQQLLQRRPLSWFQ